MDQAVAEIKLADIVTTGGTQSRISLSESAVAEYSEAMTNGHTLPPIVVFHDGSVYWLADGFHRVMAANRASIEWIAAEVLKGTKRDAILHSVGANAAHGLPRTNADKRRAVTMLLEDTEWAEWADREIARRCSVDHVMVGRIRRELSGAIHQIEASRKVERNGTVYTQRTEHIGQRHGHPGARAEKIEMIRELAGQGHRANQISVQIGLTEPTVRTYANEAGIELADHAIGKVRKIDNRRVLEQTVYGLEASAQALSAVPVSFEGITQSEASEWAAAVADALRIFRAFHKQLTEVANG